MKRISILGLALALSTQFANAQSVRVGGEAGVNLNNQLDHYQGETTSNMLKVGMNAGAILDIGISESFSIQPGLKYMLKGGQQERSYESMMTDGSMADIKIKDKLSLHYVEVPLNFVYKINSADGGNFFVGAGGYVSTLISARTKYKYNMNDEEWSGVQQLEVGTDAGKDDIDAFDYGLTGIIGYELPMGLYFKAGVDAGLNNIITSGQPNGYGNILPQGVAGSANPTSRNMTYVFSVGYMFMK